MRRLLTVGLAAVVFFGTVDSVASAGEPQSDVVSIELIGSPSTRFEVNGRRYAGPLKFTERSDGISFTELASIEQYLYGIAEMPFSWPCLSQWCDIPFVNCECRMANSEWRMKTRAGLHSEFAIGHSTFLRSKSG